MKRLLIVGAMLILLSIIQAPSSSPAAATPAVTVEFWAGNRSSVLQPLKSVPPNARIVTLEAVPLIMRESAVLRLGEASYALDQEGLYRVRKHGSAKVVRQAILYREDAWRLAGHLSRLYTYGRRHQGDTLEKLEERARNGEPISVQCGFISVFVIQHLSAQGVPARMVQCVTGSNWNHFDDGHVLTEILDPLEKRWILYDPTVGARFRHRGRWLDLLEMTQLYRSGTRADVDYLNKSSKVDPLTDYTAIYGEFFRDEKELASHLAGFKRLLQNDEESLHRWYARVMQIPLIKNGIAPGSDAEDALLRTLPAWKNVERLSTVQFRERYYAQ